MAGGRRNLNRSGIKHSCLGVDAGQPKAIDTSRNTSPKHMPIPTLPHDSNIIFEVVMFLYTGTAVFLQFLHLYRSVFWFPEINNATAMNFYLIDPYLVGFITTILLRRLIYSIITYVILLWAPAPLWNLLEQLIRIFLLGLVMTCLAWCAFHVMKTQPIVNMFYLCYPISVYFILFGLNISPFFDVSSVPCTSEEDYKNKLLGMPLHSCSSSPFLIREEVDNLRGDFNCRMKQVLFSSMLNAYYAGFIPCCFAQNFLYYDIPWATQHLAFIWCGCFTMYLVHCYPPDYCDILHRAALHLGRWVKVEGRACHLPSHPWNDTTLWPQGTLVKYCKEIFKGEGISNAAEPGNSSHNRFYVLFCNPSVFLCLVLGLQISLIIVQLFILVRTYEWYKLFSICLLLFANHYPLFKIARDYLLLFKVYKAEALVQDKANGG